MSRIVHIAITIQDLLRALVYRLIFFRAIRRRAARIASSLLEYIPHGARTLDIGSGTGDIGFELWLKAKVRCVYLDWKQIRFHSLPSPFLVCEGQALSFADGVFDSGCLKRAFISYPNTSHKILPHILLVTQREAWAAAYAPHGLRHGSGNRFLQIELIDFLFQPSYP